MDQNEQWVPDPPAESSLKAFPDGLQPYVELLAEEVHNQWARRRYEEGWRYGPERNDDRKETPTMVPYSALPEAEKAYDRATALATLSFLLRKGITVEGSGQVEEAAGKPSILDWIQSQDLPDTRRVEQVWESHDPGAWKEEPEAYRYLADLASGLGAPFLTYDIASAGFSLRKRVDAATRESGSGCFTRLGNLVGLALLETGALHGSSRVVKTLKEEGLTNADTAGLEGRIYKARAVKATCPGRREQYFRKSRETYEASYQAALHQYESDPSPGVAGEAYYLGINVATLSFLAGESSRAREVAARVQSICEGERSRNEQSGESSPYWLYATLGEAALLLGRMQEAEAHYRKAVRVSKNRLRATNSMRRQALLVLEKMGMDPGRINDWFSPPRLLLIHDASGHASISGGRDWRQALEKWVSRDATGEEHVEVYGTLETPAELSVWAACLDAGYTLYPTLPLGPDRTREQWKREEEGNQFDRILEAAVERVGETEDIDPGESLPIRYYHQYLEGRVELRSEQILARVDRILVTPACGEPQPTPLVDLWRGKGLSWNPLKFSEGGGKVGRKARSDRPASWSIRSMLFSDAKGYSGLTTSELQVFNSAYLGAIGEVADRYRDQLLSRRTAGDGLFLVFDQIQSAVHFALDLKDRLLGEDWTARGLPPSLSMRTSLDAGPVLVYEDPVMHKPEVGGPFVNRAARIEPITPTGEIYVSESFASLARAQEVPGVVFEYAGIHILPKGYGNVTLYRMSRPEG